MQRLPHSNTMRMKVLQLLEIQMLSHRHSKHWVKQVKVPIRLGLNRQIHALAVGLPQLFI